MNALCWLLALANIASIAFHTISALVARGAARVLSDARRELALCDHSQGLQQFVRVECPADTDQSFRQMIVRKHGPWGPRL